MSISPDTKPIKRSLPTTGQGLNSVLVKLLLLGVLSKVGCIADEELLAVTFN